MSAIIRAEGLTRILPAEVPVTLVRGINLAITVGEFIAITGPSGSGKSSLLYLLGLLDRATAGRLWLNGVDISAYDDRALGDARLEQMGFVFQFHFLLPEFSALENVMLPMQRLGKLSPRACRDRAEALLASFGLADQRHKLPKQLSGGQSQRVSIARALANQPRLLLADEPTGNLDSAAGTNVQQTLKALTRQQGCAVVVVTHDPHFAAMTDRVIHIVDGQLADPS
jgi:lipoprotein-releasing system ATP-binding protein